MRRVLRSVIIKKYFETAWEVLPKDVQIELKPFIRQVREVESLTKTRISCPDGTRFGPLESGTGFTFFYKDEQSAFADVILPKILCDFTDAEGVCVILHELAHAYEYATKHQEAIENEDSEHEAWNQAIAWAKSSSLAPKVKEEIEKVGLQARVQESFRDVCESFFSSEQALDSF
jgi:hypothetical protein